MSLSQQQLGFHYYPDTDHYTQADLDVWLPVLQSAGTSWLTLRATVATSIPTDFLKILVEHEIQPIIHITDLVGTPRMAQVYTELKRYADVGVDYVIFYDRPNMRASWPASSWSHEALLNRYVKLLLPALEAQVDMGMKALLPPLEPGGDYWDTVFLQTSLALLQSQASDAVLEKLMLSTYMWTYGKPLDWGKGGLQAWPGARPYCAPDGFQDQRGFQINDWYQEIAVHTLGRRLPTVVVAGGAGPSHAFSTPEAIQLGNNEVARYLAEHGLPDALLNFCFYPLTTAENHQDFPAAWYIRPTAKDVSREEPIADEEHVCEKIFAHYVLLGLSNQINGVQLWNAIAPPIMSTRATVGFSVEEAKQAKRVTIIGDYETIPDSIDAELRASGAAIERFEKWNTDEFILAASSWAAKTTVAGVEND